MLCALGLLLFVFCSALWAYCSAFCALRFELIAPHFVLRPLRPTLCTLCFEAIYLYFELIAPHFVLCNLCVALYVLCTTNFNLWAHCSVLCALCSALWGHFAALWAVCSALYALRFMCSALSDIRFGLWAYRSALWGHSSALWVHCSAFCALHLPLCALCALHFLICVLRFAFCTTDVPSKSTTTFEGDWEFLLYFKMIFDSGNSPKIIEKKDSSDIILKFGIHIWLYIFVYTWIRSHLGRLRMILVEVTLINDEFL